jgi:hypothetical protein
MTGTKIVDLDPIISLSPEDVFLVENVSKTLSNSITYANLVSSMSTSMPKTAWQSDGNTIVSSNVANFIGVSVTDVGGVATITIPRVVDNVINFTATAGQTVITVDYSITNVSVFIGGIKLRDTSYTATNGTSITLDDALDLDTWISVHTSSDINTYADFTATANQTTFTFAYAVGSVEVFVSGVKLRNTDYVAANGTNIILNNPVSTDTWVQAITTS